MAEEVEDPFFFHQAGDECEVAFAILHAIGARRAGPMEQAIVDIGQAARIEHRLDDVERALVLEDREIAVFVEQLRPGSQRQPVMEALASLVQIIAGEHEAVEVALQDAVLRRRDRDGFAQMRQQIDLAERRDDVDQHRKRLAEPLLRLDAAQIDLFAAQIDRQTCLPFHTISPCDPSRPGRIDPVMAHISRTRRRSHHPFG